MHETIIAASCRIDGDIEAQRVRVFGSVAGSIKAQEVIVEASGHVHGALQAVAIQVFGRIDGPITADRVMIEAGGTSLGGIAAPSVSLAEGCTIQGRLDSNLPGPAAPAATNHAEFFRSGNPGLTHGSFISGLPAAAPVVAAPRPAPAMPAAPVVAAPTPPAVTIPPAQALPVQPAATITTPPASAQPVTQASPPTAAAATPKPPETRRPTKAPKSAPRGFSLDGITLRLED